jgi:hypothetical protein
VGKQAGSCYSADPGVHGFSFSGGGYLASQTRSKTAALKTSGLTGPFIGGFKLCRIVKSFFTARKKIMLVKPEVAVLRSVLERSSIYPASRFQFQAQ